MAAARLVQGSMAMASRDVLDAPKQNGQSKTLLVPLVDDSYGPTKQATVDSESRKQH